MFCTTCGAQIPAGSAYCHNCGRPAVTVPAAAPAAGTRTAVAGSGAPQTDPKAIISLVLGLAGLFLFSILAGIPAIVLGTWRGRGSGRAWAGCRVQGWRWWG
jgi:hypothetical protein